MHHFWNDLFVFVSRGRNILWYDIRGMQLLWYARSQVGYVYTMGDCDVIFQWLTLARTPRS